MNFVDPSTALLPASGGDCVKLLDVSEDTGSDLCHDPKSLIRIKMRLRLMEQRRRTDEEDWWYLVLCTD